MSHLKSFTPNPSTSPRIEKAPSSKVESFLVGAVSKDQSGRKGNGKFSQPAPQDDNKREERDGSPQCVRDTPGAVLGRNTHMHAAAAFLARQMLHCLARQPVALPREADASRGAPADVAKGRHDGIQ